jgi:hypothetical protein
MKYISALLLLAALQINAQAQKINEADVPTSVKTNFTSMFNATVTSWEKKDGNYQASYTTKGLDNMALYDADGKFIRYENHITANEAPSAAIKYISTNMPGKKMDNIIRMKSVTGGLSYAIEVGGQHYLFDTNGNFVSQTEVK